MRLLRLESFLDRGKVRRFRIVHERDRADLAHKFAAMRAWLVGAERRNHLLEGQAARQSDGERRHQVLDVVRAAQLRVGHAQDRLVLINDRAALEPEIGVVRVGAEGDDARGDLRQCLRPR